MLSKQSTSSIVTLTLPHTVPIIVALNKADKAPGRIVSYPSTNTRTDSDS